MSPCLDLPPEAAGILSAFSAEMSPSIQIALQQASRLKSVASGEIILTEGALGSELYLVVAGTFGVYRRDPGDRTDHRVAGVSAGQAFGEMALLDGEARSASVRAEEDGCLIELDPEALLSQPDGVLRLSEFKGELASLVTRRMRATNQEHIAALQRELKLREEQQHFGKFFVYSLIMMSIGTLVNNVLARSLTNIDIYTAAFAWQYLAVLMVPSLLIIRHMQIPLSDLGLTTRGLGKSLREGALISAGLCAITFGLAAGLRHFDVLPGKALPFDPWGSASYFVHSALQEVIARGFLQSSFQRFLGDKRGWRSVILASVLFGMFHLHFGLPAVLMTIATGCVFGWIYIRHQNIAGVVLIHYMMGVAAFNSGLL
jgi:CRP-like cAMP-binding protein